MHDLKMCFLEHSHKSSTVLEPKAMEDSWRYQIISNLICHYFFKVHIVYSCLLTKSEEDGATILRILTAQASHLQASGFTVRHSLAHSVACSLITSLPRLLSDIKGHFVMTQQKWCRGSMHVMCSHVLCSQCVLNVHICFA